MEAEDQDAAVRTGGQSDDYSWMFSDGRFDAAENWRRIQNARQQNETAEEAEDPRTEPDFVAMEMVEVEEHGGMAAVRASQILEERFFQWDKEERDRRRQEFMAQVEGGFREWGEQNVYENLRGDWEEPEGQQTMGCVINVLNLADNVTDEMLKGTFEQIGAVVGAGVEDGGCGWVEFDLVEDAVDAIQRFGGVELAGQAMVCRLAQMEN